MDYLKVEMCVYLLLTTLWLIADVKSNAIPAIPPLYFPSDCKGMPNCNGAMSTVQDAVVRILTAHQEYGQGIHSLHKLYGELSKDFANLKNQLNSLEKKYVTDKLQETNKSEASTKIPSTFKKQPPDVQVHGHAEDIMPKTLEELFENNHIWTIHEFNSFQTLFINITTNLRTQARKSSKLLKRINTFRKDVKKYTHLVRHMDKKLLNHADKDSFEENSRKQKTINTKLESRITQLEQLLNRPAKFAQRDEQYGTGKNNGLYFCIYYKIARPPLQKPFFLFLSWVRA